MGARPYRSATEREIAETIGQPLADRLLENFGGTRIYIPFTIPDDHQLCRALGRQGADQLAAWGGGSVLDIPNSSVRARMRQRVVQAWRDGQKAPQIALANELSERHVYRILKQQAEEER